ncbi:MAG: chlorite dismutase family protein [Hyphomonadaceae bacterium]|nr:chlorite dismutase family protein [Hyphomonadaceae bacterium]
MSVYADRVHVRFVGGAAGPWAIRSVTLASGSVGLEPAARLAIADGAGERIEGVWTLAGVTSHMRYTTSAEAQKLRAVQPPLGRAAATRAALIPIGKSPAWWSLAQDERRAIYEERSRHTTIGLDYLPRIARRLHHCRDLGGPFDFLTWFEFAPEHEAAFDHMLARMRASEEWTYVDREVDVRLTRDA